MCVLEALRIPTASAWPQTALFPVVQEPFTHQVPSIGPSFGGWGVVEPLWATSQPQPLCQTSQGQVVQVPVLLSPDSLPILAFDFQKDSSAVILAGSYRVLQNVQVPKGAQLILQPGVHLFMGPTVDWWVEGTLRAEGLAHQPIVFTALNAQQPWGGVAVKGTAQLREVILSGGGGNPQRNFGHSDSHPVLEVLGGQVLARRLWVVHNPGKGIGGQGGLFQIDSSLVAWCDMGGEFNDTELHVSHSAFLFFPDPYPEFRDDDNDGLYVRSSEPPGPDSIWSTIDHSLFYQGQDDGIDHNGALLRIQNTQIRGFAHEGLAASAMGVAWIENSVVEDCEQGLEAGHGAPQLVARRVLLRRNGVGLRLGDSYPHLSHTGQILADSLAFASNIQDVLNQRGDGEPLDSLRIQLVHSELLNGSGYTGTGNVAPSSSAYAQAGLEWPVSGYQRGPKEWLWVDSLGF